MITIYLCKLDFYLFELNFKLHFWKFYFSFKNEFSGLSGGTFGHLNRCANVYLENITKCEDKILTPISDLDLTNVRAQGSGFLLAHWLWTVYLQPEEKKIHEWMIKTQGHQGLQWWKKVFGHCMHLDALFFPKIQS